MNSEHLRAFVWVRWRLFTNQIRRSGRLGALLQGVIAALMILGGLVTLIGGFVVGAVPLRGAPPTVVMLVWDAAVVGFVFFWMVGLMSELQRSEMLSLDRFMHLPVSPSGAFLINYLGSSVSLALVLFLPGMMGLATGLVFSRGPRMLVLFPLVASFFLMVTALTYQFRGWLASMMANPRRRRTVVAVVTLAFILVFQIPNILTTFGPARDERRARAEARRLIEQLDEDLASGRITQEEHDARVPVSSSQSSDGSGVPGGVDEQTIRLGNALVPVGWLPYGADAASNGRFWPPLAAVLGMGLIGAASLRRAYRTTIRMYMGDFDLPARVAHVVPPVAANGTQAAGAASAAFLERSLPWISETASAVAFATFRSLMRAPEVKMILLTPVIMMVVLGGMFAGGNPAPYELVRPLSRSGLAAVMMIVGMVGFVGNQFGFDRNGFRAFVLSPAPRRDILLGKNLALMPVACGLMAFVVLVAQWFDPMRLDHLAGVLVQIVPMYLLFCLAGNILSILAPMALKTGSGMPSQHQGIRVLYQIGFMVLVPVPLALTLVPLGIEAVLAAVGWFAWFPAFLVFGVAQAMAIAWLYGVALDWVGDLLVRHEERILAVVSSRGE